MLRFDHLLCLVAPASSSSPALRQAVHLAAACDTTVHVMSIGEAVSQSDVSDAVEAEERRLGTSVHIDPHTEVLPDDRAEALVEIKEYVGNAGADLVLSDVLPNPENEPAGDDRWGCALVEQLDCPIFMADACDEPDRVERILVPTDLTASSVHILKHAIGLATCYDASIVLLHVLEASPYVALTPMDRLSLGATTLSEHRARRQLHQLVKKAGTAEGEIHPRIVFGTPVDQITRFVDENDVDLVVLSSPRASAGPDRPLGPVTDDLLRRLACPFFLVRPSGKSLLSAEEELEAGDHGDEDSGSSVSSAR